jgi:guanine deaminase
VHYPQTAIIASWGKRLIDWLNSYTFPEEMRFADPAYAAEIANRYLDLTLANGTTTVCSYAPSTPSASMRSSGGPSRGGCGSIAGKTCMDRNAPEGLRDTPQSAYDDSKRAFAEMARGGPAVLCHHAALFADLDARTTQALGALWREHPDCLMQTHLSEQTDEIAWVKDAFPAVARLSRHLRGAGPAGRRRALRPRHPPDRPRNRPLREAGMPA